MKSLVYFEPFKDGCNFEGTRLRKSLKGALELSGGSWVSSFFASPDIVHLISPDDDGKAHDAAIERKPVVVSALYCENDPGARYLEKNSKTGEFALKKNASRLLSYADLVLVPNSMSKDFLLKNWVNKRIEILPSGVNLTRFEKNDPIENSVFFRYVSLEPTTKYVISVGDYDDNEAIAEINAIAKAVPNLRFFFIGLLRKGRASSSFRKHLSKNSAPNLTFLDLLEDDVYRSALMSATAYLSLGFSHPDNMVVYEANAARVQVFSLGPKPLDDSVKDKVNGLVFPNAEKLSRALQSYSQGKGNATIIGGYKVAKGVSLMSVGQTLMSLYKGLIIPEETTL